MIRVPAAILGFVFLLLFGLRTAGAEGPEAYAALSEAQKRFVAANVQWTVGHEIGHALIHQLDLPVFGREEDAADMLAAMLLVLRREAGLQPDFRDRLKAVADGWLLEWLDDLENESEIPYWDQHSLDIQRLFSFTCLIFGSDPNGLTDLAETATLPVERALYCPEEYQQAVHAIDWVTRTYGRPAGEALAPGDGRFTVTFEAAGANRVQPLIDLIRKDGFTQEAADRISERLRLPHDVGIVFTDCGNAEAFYNRNTMEVVICYQLLERFAAFAIRRDAAEPGASLCDLPVSGLPGGRRFGCPEPPDRSGP